MLADVSPLVYVRDALGVARRHPASIQFSVNSDLVGNELRWTGWGHRITTGRGWFTERRTGSQRTVSLRGTITLTKVVHCSGRRFYSRAVVAFDHPSKAAFQPRLVITPC